MHLVNRPFLRSLRGALPRAELVGALAPECQALFVNACLRDEQVLIGAALSYNLWRSISQVVFEVPKKVVLEIKQLVVHRDPVNGVVQEGALRILTRKSLLGIKGRLHGSAG